MKRSEINRALQEMEATLKRYQINLPPFCHFTPADWQEKGHEYDDPGFFTAMGRLGKEMGFTWGGDWRSFPDRPHFQWDGGGKYTSSMVRAGRYPPPMPRFEEEETMTQEQFNTLMEGYWRSLAQREPADWSAEAREWAEKNGLIVGDGNGNKQYRSFVTREQLAVFLKRLRELEK